MAKTFRFNLLDNAMDSLRQGIRFALKDEPNQSELKLSVLLAAQSVELLLKERLRREHWSLIFRNVEQAGNLNANTVTIDEAIKRLEKIAKVTLEDGEKESINHLSNVRNAIQHFEIEITFEEVIGKVYAAIGFITRFLMDEFEIDIREYSNEEDVQKLVFMDEVIEHLQELARRNIEKIQEKLEPRKPKDQMYWQFDVIDCPQCWQEFYIFSPDEDISQCQLCNYEGGFIECDRCGYKAPSGSWDFHSEDPDFAICESCWEDIQSE